MATARSIEEAAKKLVKEDKDGRYSYNCPKHGLDSGCTCKESGYPDALAIAKARIAHARLLKERNALRRRAEKAERALAIALAKSLHKKAGAK